MKIDLITPSYAPDYDRCRALCESVETYVSGIERHLLIVDYQDLKLFKRLESQRCSVIAKEDILPPWLHTSALVKALVDEHAHHPSFEVGFCSKSLNCRQPNGVKPMSSCLVIPTHFLFAPSTLQAFLAKGERQAVQGQKETSRLS